MTITTPGERWSSVLAFHTGRCRWLGAVEQPAGNLGVAAKSPQTGSNSRRTSPHLLGHIVQPVVPRARRIYVVSGAQPLFAKLPTKTGYRNDRCYRFASLSEVSTDTV
jgi:hypothetical protein